MTQAVLIDAARVWDRLMRLAQIGALPHGGVNRQALTQGEAEAWRLIAGWADAERLEAACDAAGNLYVTLAGVDRSLPPVMMGSHIDSQPTGGKFDGAAGVMSALEVLTAIKRGGLTPQRDMICVAWMNEEGGRFAPGMMGSEVFAGERTLEAIRAARDLDGVSVAEALDTLLAAFADLPRKPLGFPVHAFLELHIEQARLLEETGHVIGAVTGMQGKKTYEILISGSEGHAGTLRMSARSDAVASFARIADRLFDEVGTLDPEIKFTVGRVVVEPNAPSVVPSRVMFRIDMRHPDNGVLARGDALIHAICKANAGACGVDVRLLIDAPCDIFDQGLRAMITQAARQRGYRVMDLLSSAGHDARQLNKVTPTAMIFVPCRDGVSHAENEWAEPAHIAAGTQVLADVALRLASAS